MKLLRIVFFLWVLDLMLLSCKSENKGLSLPTQILIDSPKKSKAGNFFYIHLQAKGYQKPQKINLIFQSTWGLEIREFEIEKDLYIRKREFNSGLLTITASIKGENKAEKKVEIVPLVPAMPLDTYLGSKSIIANGSDWALIVGIPSDKHGNLVKEGTPILFKMIRPDFALDNKLDQIKYGLAFQKIFAKTLAGKTFVGVSTMNVHSREKELLEVADYPVDFNLIVQNTGNFADSRQNLRVKTSILKDRFGNVVPDGTSVKFIVKDPRQKLRQLYSFTLMGSADLYLQNPAVEGTVSIQGFVEGGGKSNIASFSFKNAIQDFPVSYNRKLNKIFIGPVISNLNQVMADGTVVDIYVGKKQFEVELVDGSAEFFFDNIYPSKQYPLKVFIRETKANIKSK